MICFVLFSLLLTGSVGMLCICFSDLLPEKVFGDAKLQRSMETAKSLCEKGVPCT